MPSTPAPYYSSIVNTPLPAKAFWTRTSDNVRLRVAYWTVNGQGTVLLFPGRTEYIEKYGDIANELADHGFGMATIDWRGHGLSDRLSHNRDICHVADFKEYQLDVVALEAVLNEIGAQRPWFLVAHSMGGCIGLRALMNGLDVIGTVFLAPMWRIYLGRILRHVTFATARTATLLGLSERFVVGTDHRNYVHFAKSRKNVLTSDLDTFSHLRTQLDRRPELSLGGPSYGWLDAALKESRALLNKKAPIAPALILMGSNEKVVDPKAIRIICANWPASRIGLIEGARHEILMEDTATRELALDWIASYLERQLTGVSESAADASVNC